MKIFHVLFGLNGIEPRHRQIPMLQYFDAGDGPGIRTPVIFQKSMAAGYKDIYALKIKKAAEKAAFL